MPVRAVLFVLAVMASVLIAGAAVPPKADPQSGPVPGAPPPQKCKYPWLQEYNANASLTVRIRPPTGFLRTQVEVGDFADWLQRLPLKPAGTPVRLFDGRLSPNQDNHAAVIDIDVGNRDLMQCADAVIRLRAEYLYSIGHFEAIHFNFTSGDRIDFTRWAAGEKPSVKGAAVTWIREKPPGAGHESFRAYLDTIFTYAGTVSLAAELKAPAKIEDLKIGDVFIHPGTPGHAALVVDLAMKPGSNQRVFLLAQGFMPAQDIHILKNPRAPGLDPWFSTDFGETLETPSWTFQRTELKRF